MADVNGPDNTQRRLDALEQMDKLLLRAQVLQQDAIETLQSTIKRQQQWQERQEQWNREAEQRGGKLDERIERLVNAIADLIRRIPPGNLRDTA